MTDLSPTVLAKSDQLTADDLLGGPRTIKITNVRGVAGEQPVAIDYEGGDGKPYYPCKTMRRVLIQLWDADGKAYIGRSLTLFRDAKVTFGALAVGGIRISHMSGLDSARTVPVTAKKGAKVAYKVEPLRADVAKPAATGRAPTAAEWTDGRLAELPGITDLSALAEWEAGHADKLNALAKRPELHDRLAAAIRARFVALAPVTDGPDNPAADEGPADEQRGDAFAD